MLACMFPGQGSQFPGMGRELFAVYPELCEIADATLGYSIRSLCAGKDPARMNATVYTQPAIFFVSCLAYLERRKDSGFQPDFFLGHSLGLYAGLFAASVFDLATGLRIVARRAQIMSEVSGGAMMAVLGDAVARLPQVLLQHEFHDVDVANFNSPTQTVISGKAARLGELQGVLEAAGYRCVGLPVSGAFHSRHMEPARQQFLQFLQTQPLRAPAATVVSTTSAERVGFEHMLEELAFQLTKPVRWLQTVLALQVRHRQIRFEEVGPGQVLTHLNAQILARN